MATEFDKAQLQAINHREGPALVIAGPGSGKTTVITHRTLKLISDFGVPPANILVITFTRMAAAEMKERFFRLADENGYGSDARKVSFGTFHSVFFTILRHAYNYSASNIVSGEMQRDVIRQTIATMSIEIEDENEFISLILSEIGKVKSERINVDSYYSINCSENDFRTLYRAYQQMLSANRLIDFEDMLVYTHELLSQRKDILGAWQRKFRYILVDEFQDINQIQYDVVRLLAGTAENVFVVGDDDQSIYGFRGARPDMMKSFERDYGGVRSIRLDINYRSTSNIVEAARRVIDHNHNRFSKNIRTGNQKGNNVEVHEFRDISDENEAILERLRNVEKLSQVAILTRTNIGGRSIMGKLIEYNIPFVARDVIPSLYEHWIARNIFAYVRLSMGERDRKTFLQVMNKPKRYISRDMLLEETVDFDVLCERYRDKDWMVERLEDFEGDLKVLSRCAPFAAINYIRRSVGYDAYIREYAREHRINEDDLFGILDELTEGAREFGTYDEWFAYIDDYNRRMVEQSRQRKLGGAPGRNGDGEALTICTMHGCKGLEYDEVFIIDANEGIAPYSKAVLDEEIEEERRLFYVAMTRARKMLHIYHVKERYNKELEPSRFIGELLKG